jgi:hypothetical protein
MANVKQTSRVILNRSKIDTLRLGIADALFGVALEVLDNTHPPDAPPYGKGLVEGGGAVAWVDKRKVNGTTIGGRQIKKPRSLKLDVGVNGIVAIVGYGFPGRLVHNGSIHNRANPFLRRSGLEVLPEAKGIAGNRLQRWIRGMR